MLSRPHTRVCLPAAGEKDARDQRSRARSIEMADELAGTTVAFVVANEGVEQVELTEPWKAVERAGGTPRLLAPAQDAVQAFNHLDKADTFEPDERVGEADPGRYDALVLPGGVANPDQLRMSHDAVRFIRSFFEHGKPVAVICHGPWTLVEAGVVRDRTLTSWPSLQTDIRNAGGKWIDQEVVQDDGLVSSRKPADLPAFCQRLVDVFSSHRVGHARA
jgi:protease I